MVVLQPKSPYPLLLFVLLCFSSGLLSLGYQIPRYRTDIDRCIDQCREEVEDVSGLFSCAFHCDRKYAGTEWEPEGFERQLQQCQERCQSKEHGGRQLQQCQRRCVEQERERKQEREREQRESEREKREREHHRERREREEREQQEEEEEEKERGKQREEEQEGEQEREQEESERQQREREQQEEIERQRERERREEEQEEIERQREREREEREQREKEQEEIERQREREREARERDRERERETISRDYYSRDPEEEYKECQQLCKKEPATQEPQCKRRCKRQYEDIKGTKLGKNQHEPQQQYEQCRKICERQERGEQHQQQCKSWCEQQREKEERRGKREQNPQREEQQQRNNPYYFQAQRFQYRFRSQEGHIKVLQRFSERSELLLGIDNYRLVIAEANPGTLMVPHHSDAENFLVVVRGRGIVTLVSQERRESFNMELGDVLRISAGTTAYLVNQDNNEKLQQLLLTLPVNTPGRFRGQEYFAAGGGNPESYYRVFSHDILQRALNTPSDQLERLFEGERRQHGVIRRATPEQLKALSHHPSPKQPGMESSGPFNLLRRKPLYHNNFGRFFEVTPNDYKQLQESGVSVAYVEINQGAMMVPHYNSKTTTIVLVVEGRGLLEMGCPHLSRQSQGSQEKREQTEEEGESSAKLQKITAHLSPGDVFIIPAGHPIALVAQNENLRTVGFGINALNNQRNFLAGKINIMNQVEREAMEIAFNVPARLVERIFSNNPKESYFVAGPELAGPEEEQREEGRRHLFPSVLDLAGFF